MLAKHGEIICKYQKNRFETNEKKDFNKVTLIRCELLIYTNYHKIIVRKAENILAYFFKGRDMAPRFIFFSKGIRSEQFILKRKQNRTRKEKKKYSFKNENTAELTVK